MGRRGMRQERRGFMAVIAALLLATSAASVISAGLSSVEGARLSGTSLDAARARAAASGGAALALSAERAGVNAGSIVVDLEPALMTFEEPSDNPEGVWVARARSGAASAQAVVTP